MRKAHNIGGRFVSRFSVNELGPDRPRFPARRVAVGLSLLFLAAALTAQEPVTADAVVIVDTSTSMRNPGMDPERTSLLVTKLLADIVPGELAAVRLLDLVADNAVLPSRETGMFEPCQEDPSRQCGIVEPASDWYADARAKRLGSLARPARGDAAFKTELESHLEQRINNSVFGLAFRAAQGVLDQRAPRPGVPRTVVWLSDGNADDPVPLKQASDELRSAGVAVEAIVFGRGDPRLAREAGLNVRQTSSPAELMKAFAGAFRRIVQAPYEIDNLVSAEPRFEMKPNVEEAWVVVYGDPTLGEVTLETPEGGRQSADYARESWPGAGAYRVAYLRRPKAGGWTVRAQGGGFGVAYAVVQRSALAPDLLEPENAVAGSPTTLVAGVVAGLGGDLVNDPELLRDLTLTAEVEGQVLTFRDDGTDGDAVAGDGRFAASHVFQRSGDATVRLRLAGEVVDRTVEETIRVSGLFRYTGGPVEIDLGTLGAGTEACRPLTFTVEHQGEIPFELDRLRSLPSGHRLEARLPGGTLHPGGETRPLRPGEAVEICLAASPRAPSSTAAGEEWLALRVAGSDSAEHRVPIRLRWTVEGLTFWQRWGWLILSILGVLVLLFIVGGYVLPKRFSGTLAVTFVPERDELDEQTPQPVRQWKGVGIGFYRNARAYLHPDFRLSGRPQGALACLHAERGGPQVLPGRGAALWRETIDGDWDAVPAPGRRARAGDVYRVGEQGPYFRIAVQRGRR